MTTITDGEISEDDYQLSEDEKSMLKERREAYAKNPEQTRIWEEVQAELKQRYAL